MSLDWDKYGCGMLAPEQRDQIFRGKDRVAVQSLAAIYGQDVNDLINALHSLVARIAIAAECDPVGFAQGMQHHWNDVCEHLEECANRPTATTSTTSQSSDALSDQKGK